ncbi:hypothetical protein EX30DRAFT_252932 [Ascodesmis nigricans]|uniref:Extensin domain-containing protein n=1 Tax=Ascodesmis nigricans TaxID=341454 RepID=A0A4S2MY47_9PEZI|nr:hypothetical protein EX30DRAFT_252932 [Ascodesmis nigricans]
MPGHIIWDFAPQPLHMRHLPASNSAYLPSTCDEELADEADEPPDTRSYSPFCLSDPEFHKSTIRHSPPTESLLTKALTSPPLMPIDDLPARRQPQREMSSSSAWSVASTAELTSDGLTSPSRANTPSPPPPLYLSGLGSILPGPKMKFALPAPVHPVPSTGKINTLGDLEQKRQITFACAQGRPSQQPQKPQEPKTQSIPQPRKSALTFVCNKPTDKVKVSDSARPARLRSPAPNRIAKKSSKIHAESEGPHEEPLLQHWYGPDALTESWTLEPFDKTRLLRVDDLLKKEQEIRKLSEEAEAEAMEEDEDVIDDDENDEEDAEHDEDTTFDQDEDEEDEMYLDDDDYDHYYGESGNETDNEEGFASDDESDDELFFGPRLPPNLIPVFPTSSPRRIRSPSPQPPDNGDFVCGTFDEDKPLEDAYLSALEERKRLKHVPTPQDIDPSFPVDDDDDEEEEEEHAQPMRRRSDAGRANSRSPQLRGRAPSPAPIRRRSIALSPAPMRRLAGSPGSRHISRHTSRQASRQASRQTSPIPRGRSPAPVRRNSVHIQFTTGHDVVKTHSLPRPGACFRRTGKAKAACAVPGQKKARPMPIKRGAMDIYEGLEKRRERRKAKLARKGHEGERRVGEGVEKMREIALDLCGRGRRQAQWVISA